MEDLPCGARGWTSLCFCWHDRCVCSSMWWPGVASPCPRQGLTLLGRDSAGSSVSTRRRLELCVLGRQSLAQSVQEARLPWLGPKQAAEAARTGGRRVPGLRPGAGQRGREAGGIRRPDSGLAGCSESPEPALAAWWPRHRRVTRCRAPVRLSPPSPSPSHLARLCRPGTWQFTWAASGQWWQALSSACELLSCSRALGAWRPGSLQGLG